jgi:hypothetical protein
MKGAFKKLLSGGKKKDKTETATPTATAPTDASSSTPKPTETKPAEPAPVTAPEPAKTAHAPATDSTPPAAAPAAAPAPAGAPAEDKTDAIAALAEVKKATHSKTSSHCISTPVLHYGENDCGDGSRRRMRVEQDHQDSRPAELDTFYGGW